MAIDPTTPPTTITPDASTQPVTATPSLPDYTQQTTPATLTPPPAFSAPATAPASAASGPMPGLDAVMASAQPKGLLAKIAIGALHAVATAGRGVEKTISRVASNSPYGQELQKNLIARQQAQQTMQLKQNEEQRAQQEEGRAEQKETREEADWKIQHNVLAMNETHQAFMNHVAEDKAQAEINDANGQFFTDLKAMGVDPAQVQQKFTENLNKSHAAAIANGKLTPLATDDKGDDAGLHLYNTADLNYPLPADITIPTEWHVDPKTGQLRSTATTTLTAGNNTAAEAWILKNSEQKKGQVELAQWQQGQKSQQEAADTQKKINEAGGMLTKLEQDPSQMAGEKAPAVVAKAQEMVNDPSTPLADKVRWQRIGRQAALASQIVESNKVSLAKAEEAAKDGDPEAAGQLLYEGTTAPAQLVSTRKPEFATKAFQAAKRIAQEHGEEWDAKTADAQFKTASAPANVAFFGSANSLLDAGGTLDQLTQIGATIPQNQIPVFNKLEDWQKAQSGGGPIAGYAATALGVADDYSKVMGGGAGSDTSRMQALNLISAAKSPQQRAAAIQSIRNAVNSQKNSRIGNNRTMRNMYGGTPSTPPPNPAKAQQNAGKTNPF